MAKINTKTAHEVGRLLNLKNGRALLIRSDRQVLTRCIVSGDWKIYRKIRASISPEQFIANRLDHPGYHWVPLKRGMIPSWPDIQEMDNDGISSSTDGCEGIEPDGRCIHGYPSWLLIAQGLL